MNKAKPIHLQANDKRTRKYQCMINVKKKHV
uniref:Uncharacterized protein n=1 Tax=Rhizophora mucronata TaxID=61149 RepID=A0A2P2QKD2_RHIMU